MPGLEVSWVALIGATLVVGLGAMVQRTLGMGFGQVAAPLLLLIDPEFVPVAVILMGTGVATFAAIKDRGQADHQQAAIALVGRLTGAVLAGWLLAQWIDTAWFSRLFGVMILIAVLTSLVRWRVPVNGASLLVAGTLSGFMGTITSVGAPPMGLVYQNEPGPRVRGTLNLFFSIGAGISLLVLWLNGLLGWHDCLLALTLLPGLIAGSWLAGRVTAFVDRRFRALVLVLCVVSAVAILIRSFV